MRAAPLNDVLTGAVMVVFAALVTAVTAGYPATSGGFPFALATYMVLPLGVLLLAKGLLRMRVAGRGNAPRESGGVDTQAVQFTPVTVGVILAVCVSTFAIGWLGFIAAVGLLALATGLLFRSPLWATAIYVAGQSALLWGFLRFFNIQMPQGLLL